MKLIDLLNKIANGEIKEGTKLCDIGTYVFKNGRFVDENDNSYIYVVDDEVLNDEVEIIEEKQQQGRWKPKEGEYYWYIDTYRETHKGVWLNDNSDNWRYTTKNVFKTEEEAEEYLEYKAALLKAEKPFVKNEINCKLTFSTKDRRVFLSGNFDEISQGTIYLGQDEDVAQAFLDKWKKQILKYEFGIEE